VQGKINRGRHRDHPAGHHSIRTNQCPPSPRAPNFRVCYTAIKNDTMIHPQLYCSIILVQTTVIAYTQTHLHICLMAIFTRKPRLAGCPFNFLSPFIPNLCILLEQTKTFHITFHMLSFSSSGIPSLFHSLYFHRSTSFLFNKYQLYIQQVT